MTYLVYDNTFEGFLTAIFEVYELKLTHVAIRKSNLEIPPLFGERIIVINNETKAKRVAKKIIAILGKQGIKSIYKTLLIEEEDIEDTLLKVIRYTIATKKNILNDFGHPEVLKMQQVLRKISRERHRMNAFIRFKLANDGIYYAFIEPDFDVLPLISPHFESRYADQKWLIYDLRRKKGIFYDLAHVITVTLVDKAMEKNLSLEFNLHDTEKEFQKLWQSYFKHTNILSRKNIKLHLQHVPKRYWKHLTEKEGLN